MMPMLKSLTNLVQKKLAVSPLSFLQMALCPDVTEYVSTSNIAICHTSTGLLIPDSNTATEAQAHLALSLRLLQLMSGYSMQT